MGVDIQDMKRRQMEEDARKTSKGSGGGWKYWTPKDGKNRVRLMPPWSYEGPNKGSFYRCIAMHWGVGPSEDNQHTFPCPQQTPYGPEAKPGGSCPVCAYVLKLRASNNPADDEYANSIRSKMRYYSNVVDMNDQVYTQTDQAEWKSRQQDATRECPFSVGDSKVQVWAYAPSIFKEIMDVFCEQGIDITDFDAGHDLHIVREGQGRETKYRTRIDFQASKFAWIGKEVGKTLVNLDTVVQFQTAQQMQAVLDGSPSGAPQVAAPKLVPALPAPAPAHVPAAAVAASAPAVAAATPPCFKDKDTCDDADAECVGGTKGNEAYDPCPFFKECHEAKFGAPQKASRRRSAAAAPAPTTENTSAVDALEAEMKKVLSQ